MLGRIINAIENNFVLDKTRKGKLFLDPEFEESQTWGYMFLIGVANQNGVDAEEVRHHLGIQKSEYLYRLNKVMELLQSAQELLQVDRLQEDTTEHRFWMKYLLVSNYLKYHRPVSQSRLTQILKS